MAGNNDEGQWTNVRFDITDLLQPISPVVDTTGTIIEVLVTSLNVLGALLEVAKTFTVGLLNPLRALAEEVLLRIRAYLADLRRIGFYIYIGDSIRTQPNYSALLGGYPAFENRIIRSLTSGQDRSRPQANDGTSTTAVVFYSSTDLSAIADVLELDRSLRRLFGVRIPFQPYTAPTNVRVLYGNPDLGLASFTPLGKRITALGSAQAAAVQWQMPSGFQNTDQRIPAPGGFLVEISTVAGGFRMSADAPLVDSTNPGVIVGRKRMPVLDSQTNQPVVIYGGTDSIRVDTTPSANAGQAYLVLDQNTPYIPVNALRTLEQEDGKRYFGRTLFVRNATIRAMPPGQGFSMVIRKEDLPYTGDVVFDFPSPGDLYGKPRITNTYQPSNYYIRIRAVDPIRARQIMASRASGTGSTGNPLAFNYPLYDEVTSADIEASATTQVGLLLSNSDPGAFSTLSSEAIVSFPSDSRLAQTIQVALIIAVLSRSDLPVNTQAPADGVARLPTGLESIMKQQFKALELNRAFYTRFENDPVGFARAVLQKTGAITNKILNSLVSSGLGDTIIRVGGPLLQFRWADFNPSYPNQTILESLSDAVGISRTRSNSPALVWSTGNTTSLRSRRMPQFWPWLSSAPLTPTPQISNFVSYNLKGSVLTDYSPSIRGDATSDFCRNALADLYPVAQNVLAITLTQPTNSLATVSGNWVAVKFLPNGIPQLEKLLGNLDTFMSGLLSGLDGVGNALVDYIDFIQSRIRNLQALLDQIQGLIQYLDSLTLPSASVLVVSANGTIGIVQGIINAENKPQDSNQSYGYGFAVVGVGLPAPLSALVQALFAGSD
jgi:hypothetical protein